MTDRSHVLQAAATFQAKNLPDINTKPGQIVEKVKDELHKTIEAKRKLLERNYINFRYDEFKELKASD